MVTFILQSIISFILFVWAKLYAGEGLKTEIYGILIGIGIVWIIDLGNFIFNKKHLLRLYWDSYKPFVRARVRLTIAYLLKIEVQGKFLLIESKRYSGLYQPVGGAYKYFQPEATQFLNGLGFIPDNAIPNDAISENDLRFDLPDRTNIPAFLSWFLSMTQRELDPWREFYEELVVTGILTETNFKYLHYELCAQHIEPIHFDTHFQKDTLKYADIYTPKFVNQSQIAEIQLLRQVTGNKFIWATEAEITNGVSETGKRIATHTKKLFYNKKISYK